MHSSAPVHRIAALALLCLHFESASAQEAAESLFVSAGQGTSATHAPFDRMCKEDVGIAACHWLKCCDFVPEHVEVLQERVVSLWKLAALCISVEPKKLSIFFAKDLPDPHRRLDWYKRRDWRSKHDETASIAAVTGCDGEKWIASMKTTLQEILNSGVRGLVDSPYPYLLDDIFEMHPHERIKLIMTDRDPLTWAERRREGHPVVPLCREPVGEVGRLGSILGCVQNAIDAAGRSVLLQDALMIVTDLPEDELAHEYHLYRDHVRKLAADNMERDSYFEVDLWTGVVNGEQSLTPEQQLEEDPIVKAQVPMQLLEDWMRESERSSTPR